MQDSSQAVRWHYRGKLSTTCGSQHPCKQTHDFANVEICGTHPMRYQQMADTAASRMVCSRMFMVFLDRMAPAHNCKAADTAAGLGQRGQ
jgi:hypothetical protein